MSGNHKYKDFHVTVLGPDTTINTGIRLLV